MDVKVHFLGILAQYFQTSSTTFQFSGTPTLADLFGEINRRFGDKLPKNLWDAEKKAFNSTSTVFIRGKGRDFTKATESLLEGEEIFFLLPQAGG